MWLGDAAVWGGTMVVVIVVDVHCTASTMWQSRGSTGRANKDHSSPSLHGGLYLQPWMPCTLVWRKRRHSGASCRAAPPAPARSWRWAGGYSAFQLCAVLGWIAGWLLLAVAMCASLSARLPC